MAAKGLNTFAAFAFLVPYNPSGPGEDAVLREALKDVLGHEPDTPVRTLLTHAAWKRPG